MMATLSGQDLIVGVVVLGAAALVVRHLLGVTVRRERPGCAKCASGDACAPTPSATAGAGERVHVRPLVFVRPPRT